LFCKACSCARRARAPGDSARAARSRRRRLRAASDDRCARAASCAAASRAARVCATTLATAALISISFALLYGAGVALGATSSYGVAGLSDAAFFGPSGPFC